MSQLQVFFEDRPIAMLEELGRRDLRLTYHDEWAGAAHATPLSVSLPLAAGSHRGRGLAAYLWGLLPDNERVLQRWARSYSCAADDVFGLLRGVGADVAGAAQYLGADHTPSAGATDPGFELLQDSDVAAMLGELRADATAWHARNRGHWSLAGAQAKLALAWQEDAGRWAMPIGSAPTTHIFKPAIVGLDHHDLNEHLCLSAARAVGLVAARSWVASFDDQAALVVQRYDRVATGGRVRRVHQEDCCQALGVHPEQKYESDGGPTLEQLCNLLRRVMLVDPQTDIDRLIDAAAFNWLILGTDGHAKNYSLLLSGPQVRLAPLYDLASAAPYGDLPRKLRLAQKVGGEYRPTAIGARHWARVATTARADPDALLQRITTMAEQLPDALSGAAKAVKLDRRTRAAAGTIVDAIVAWTAHCRHTLQHGPSY